jgi:hypothetical protein
MKDSEFIEWLMALRTDLARNPAQAAQIDSAINHMRTSAGSFSFWTHQEHHRLAYEVLKAFDNGDRRGMLQLSYQKSVTNTIKSCWEEVIKSRIVEMNPPKRTLSA